MSSGIPGKVIASRFATSASTTSPGATLKPWFNRTVVPSEARTFTLVPIKVKSVTARSSLSKAKFSPASSTIVRLPSPVMLTKVPSAKNCDWDRITPEFTMKSAPSLMVTDRRSAVPLATSTVENCAMLLAELRITRSSAAAKSNTILSSEPTESDEVSTVSWRTSVTPGWSSATLMTMLSAPVPMSPRTVIFVASGALITN